jgi:hypothetical protein
MIWVVIAMTVVVISIPVVVMALLWAVERHGFNEIDWRDDE